MAFKIPVFGGWGDDILQGSTPSGTAPSTSYSLATLLTGNPAARVRFGATTVSIVFTLTGSKEGAVIVLPMHNITPGSTTVAVLSNAAGLSVNLPVPVLGADGWPPTLAYDFSAQSNRTSNVWTLTITGNAANVILGGAIAIYPKKTFTGLTDNGSVEWQVQQSKTRNMTETPNEYATPYVQDYGTISRKLTFSVTGVSSGIDGVQDWYDSNLGRVRPSLFWMDPSDAKGALYGRFQKDFTRGYFTGNRERAQIEFDEWPKGQVL